MKHKIYLQNESTGSVTSLIFDYAELISGAAKRELESLEPKWYVIGNSKCTGLNIPFGQKIIFENDIFEYAKHPKYLLDSFIGKVVWIDEYACFGYEKRGASSLGLAIPFSEHDELESDFLSHCKIVGNTFENANMFECRIA